MSGLILGGIGKGIADAGASIANLMYKGIEKDEDREARRAARLEELQLRLDDRAIARKESADLRREIAEMRGGSGSGGSGGGLSFKDLGEGGAAEGLVARRAGMTVPELRALRKSSETGDMSPFMQKTMVEDESGGQDVTGLPPGFEKEYKAKLKALAEIEESYALGGRYDDVQKGRRTGQQIDATTRAEAEPKQAGIIGQAVAVGEGKDIIGGDSNVTRNKFTGDTKVTPVGQSVINENNAQAANAGKTEKNKEFQGLQQERLAIDADLKRAEDQIKSLRKDTPKGWQDAVKEQEAKIVRLEADKKTITDRIRTFTESESERSRGGKPKSETPKPSDNSKSGESSASSSTVAMPKTQAEFDKLPSGALYVNPKDGKTYRKK